MRQYTKADITRFAYEHAHLMQYYIVAHTHFRPHNKSDARIAQARSDTAQALKHALNCLTSEVNIGHASRAKRKPHIYRPATFATVECCSASALRHQTMHVNILIGNLPGILTAQDVQTLFRHCWTNKAEQADDTYVTKYDGSTRLIDYTLKEGNTGDTGSWCVENTFIPRTALHAD